MSTSCRTPGCSAKAATRYGVYCASHKTRLRRHGAVQQQGISRADLKPYIEQVRARLEKNRDKPLLTALEKRWAALIELARQTREEARVKPMVRWRREASIEVLRLGSAMKPGALIETVIAMYLFQDQDGRRFVNDKAFNTQLVRRVRGLTKLNAKTWHDSRTGKTKRVYTDLAPQTVQLIAAWIGEALGVAGLHFAKLERQEHEQRQQEREAYHLSLRDAA